MRKLTVALLVAASACSPELEGEGEEWQQRGDELIPTRPLADAQALGAASIVPAQTTALVLLGSARYPHRANVRSELINYMHAGADSISAMYQELSNGRVRFTGLAGGNVDIFGPLDVKNESGQPVVDSGCNVSSSLVRAAAIASGAQLDRYLRIVYVSPNGSPCPGNHSSVGSLSTAGVTWLIAPNPTDAANYSSMRAHWMHELGHSLGLRHASGYFNYSTRSTGIAGATHVFEYGDKTDFMGGGNLALNGAHRLYLNGGAQQRDVISGGTFTISPLGTTGSADTVLRIRRGGSLGYLYVSYRRGSGRDSQLEAAFRDKLYVNHSLYDFNPTEELTAGVRTLSSGPLGDGQEFYDSVAGIRVRKTGGLTQATVSVTYEAISTSCVRGRPAIVQMPYVATAAAGAWFVETDFLYVNTDSSACPAVKRPFYSSTIATNTTETGDVAHLAPGESTVIHGGHLINGGGTGFGGLVLMDVRDGLAPQSTQMIYGSYQFAGQTPSVITGRFVARSGSAATLAPSMSIAEEGRLEFNVSMPGTTSSAYCTLDGNYLGGFTPTSPRIFNVPVSASVLDGRGHTVNCAFYGSNTQVSYTVVLKKSASSTPPVVTPPSTNPYPLVAASPAGYLSGTFRYNAQGVLEGLGANEFAAYYNVDFSASTNGACGIELEISRTAAQIGTIDVRLGYATGGGGARSLTLVSGVPVSAVGQFAKVRASFVKTTGRESLYLAGRNGEVGSIKSFRLLPCN